MIVNRVLAIYTAAVRLGAIGKCINSGVYSLFRRGFDYGTSDSQCDDENQNALPTRFFVDRHLAAFGLIALRLLCFWRR